MAGYIFNFKKFDLDLRGAAHPVGTDSILLGAWTVPKPKGRVLDIGTGTGVLAFMMAQKTEEAAIMGLEPDTNSFLCAQQNGNKTPWAKRISIQNETLQEFAKQAQKPLFSTILCNPPYFLAGPKSENERRAKARHTDSLPFSDLINAVVDLLAPQGIFTMVLPYPDGQNFIEMAAVKGLYFSKITLVKSLAGKPYERMLLEFSKNAHFDYKNELVLMKKHKTYSDAYWEISKDFYLAQEMGKQSK